MSTIQQAPSISSFVRERFFAGDHDPENIAHAFLTEALASPDPEAWLIQCVRHSVGSQFSSLQAAIRGAHRPDGGNAQNRHGPSRQRHNDGYVYNPWERSWIPLGKATVADFEAAIAWHQQMINGHNATIAEYRSYITQIREAGVTCLDDI